MAGYSPIKGPGLPGDTQKKKEETKKTQAGYSPIKEPSIPSVQQSSAPAKTTTTSTATGKTTVPAKTTTTNTATGKTTVLAKSGKSAGTTPAAQSAVQNLTGGKGFGQPAEQKNMLTGSNVMAQSVSQGAEQAATPAQTGAATITPTNPAAWIKVPSVTPTNPAAAWEEPVTELPQEEAAEKNAAEFAVRNYLENGLGIDSDRIGWDGTAVTLDGNRLMQPEYVSEEGRSYVGGKEDVDAAISEYANTHGMVSARDYADSLGVPVTVGWDANRGTVTVNGVDVEPDFISDGRAYVYRNKMDNAIKQGDSGIRKDTDILQDAKKQYDSDVNRAYNDLMDFGDFTYDQKNDRAYQDFMDVYRRAVQDEYENNLAQARFRTGGVAAPSVLNQAAAIRSRALADAAQYAQQYEDRAYGRWQDARDMTQDELSTAWDMLQNEYNAASDANQTDLGMWQDQRQRSMEDQLFQRTLEQLDDQIASGKLDLSDQTLASYLYQLYAGGFAENEYEQDEYATENAWINALILRELGLHTARAEYENLLLRNKNAELTNQGLEDETMWNNWLNAADADNHLYNVDENAAITGRSSPFRDRLYTMVDEILSKQ